MNSKKGQSPHTVAIKYNTVFKDFFKGRGIFCPCLVLSYFVQKIRQYTLCLIFLKCLLGQLP